MNLNFNERPHIKVIHTGTQRTIAAEDTQEQWRPNLIGTMYGHQAELVALLSQEHVEKLCLRPDVSEELIEALKEVNQENGPGIILVHVNPQRQEEYTIQDIEARLLEEHCRKIELLTYELDNEVELTTKNSKKVKQNHHNQYSCNPLHNQKPR